MTKQFSLRINEKLFEEAWELSPTEIQTQRGLFELALTEFVNKYKRKNLNDIRDKITFCEDYDYKALRVGKGDVDYDFG
ncbi:MAG: type II toxin-antitoxin system VapB family antitoxin [Clostridiales bacterium]|jgi:hypothetical protein|nr:type II toxin-antitoxin system VapB family antitoxin [Clostridiales bacterium]